MKIWKSLAICVVLLVGLLAGCSSIEDESKETKSVVEQSFKSKPSKPNNENGEISFYMPSEMKIDTKNENNLILKKGDQLFILFVNPNESKDSEVMYQSINPKSEKFVINETFKDKDRFGYVKVYEIDKKLYLVSVGIGGVKMTTETKLSNISESAQEMVKVASSVTY